MKRRFSCLAIIMTMLLFGACDQIYASGFVKGIAGAADNVGGAVYKSADDVLKAVGTKYGTILGKGSGVVLRAGVTETAQAWATKLGLSVTDDLVLKLTQQSVEGTIDKLGGLALKNFDPAVLVKTFASDASSMSSKAFQETLEGLGKNTDEVTELVSKFKNSNSILTKVTTGVSDNFVSMKNFLKTTPLSDAQLTDSMLAQSRLAKGTGTFADLKLVQDLKWQKASPLGKAGKILKAAGGKLQGPLGWAGLGMAGAVVFMMPSIFQSAFLAQQAQNAMLETYVPPVKFGNIVMQLPDSVIDIANPQTSKFVYYGIPVNNPGDKLSAAAKAAYPGVSDPTAKNKVSASIDNGYAQAFSVGGVKKISIPRYNLDATALATLPVFVMYSLQSWLKWGEYGIPDAAFSQVMVNLNTGYVFYASGNSEGIPAASLLGTGPETVTSPTVQSFMALKLGDLEAKGSLKTFTQYKDSYSSAKTGTVSTPLSAQFDCSCLNSTTGVISDSIVKSCSANGSPTCLLTSALNQLSAGLVINANGQVMTPDQDLAKEVAKGALGQVIPIQGLGSKFDAVLEAFPGAQQNAIANSGALTVNINALLANNNSSSSQAVSIQGAAADNYSAKGVYIYQCKNTPLAKILRNQAGGSAATNSQITDFIVFLDSNLNQVPMMAPVQDVKNYGFIKMGLNPAIAFFSTIIGNFDSNGNFNFLPQLNIQAPATLIAKGLPASFPPLYSLVATNGSLAVNYNQNLTSVVGAIAAALMNNPKLGQQFKTMQSAMLGLVTAGPYGKYNLVPVASNMQPSIGGVNLVVYKGFNSYPVSQDQAQSACSDVLIPLSSQGKTVTLPSNSVTQYYGLVTDLTYTAQVDGTISVNANGFSNSPLSATWAIDASKVSQFYWMDKLTAMGQSSDPNFAMPPALVTFVANARTAWINWLQATVKSGLAKTEFTGITVAPNTFTIASQQALTNGLYIYTYYPCPSPAATQDYFVLTNSTTPQPTDATLGKMSATKATATTNMLSIVSGLLYNASGAQVTNSAGVAYSVNPTTLLTSLNNANPQALPNDLKAKLNISVNQAANAALTMVYPFQFSNVQLGLYQADIDKNVYVYFDAAGAGTTANFQPSDYFVTIDSYTSPSKIGAKLSASTPYIVSLISAQVSGPDGVVATVGQNVISQIIAALSAQWRPGVATQIAALTASYAAVQKANAQQTADMNKETIGSTGIVTWPQASALKIINAIASADYLLDPYSMLKQDPSSGVYVLVTPASADGTQFLYTFFSVPSSTLDANGKAINIGASYDGQGNLVRAIDGLELQSIMNQSGVAIDSTGKQYLGASNALPIMQLDPADVALKPGMTGKSMIYSNDKNFPTRGIVSPVSYKNSQFYFYYNTITLGYYAMQVTGTDIRYVEMTGGSVYNQNGSPRMDANPVAINSNGDVTDLLLPYLTQDGFVRCVMKNADNNNMYADFYNSEQDFQVANDAATSNLCGLNLLYSLDAATSAVTVAQMPFPDPTTLTAMPDLALANQYNVYFNSQENPITYKVSPNYTSQNLQILPINMTTRALLNPIPADIYTKASLVNNKDGVYAMVFANQFYTGAQKSGTNTYTLKSGANIITVSFQVDTKTNAQYIQVIAAGTTYNYQCSFMTLTDSQLNDLQRNAWQAEVVADVTGNILLAPYISIDGSGNLQLAPVSSNAVQSMPTNPSEKSALTASLGSILQDVGTNRFIVQVSSSTYPYFTQNGFVDLENGVLFDATGLIVGYTVQYADLINLLSSLSVGVLRDGNGKAWLTYRAPLLAAAINPTMSTLAPSYVPTANQGATGVPAVVTPAAPVLPAAPAPVVSAPIAVTNPVVAPAPVPVVSNPNSAQIAKLQAQNNDLQTAITANKLKLQKETISQRRQVLQNAISINQKQIDLNNQQIAKLNSSATNNKLGASERSKVLGR